jgi:hypothetical protein
MVFGASGCIIGTISLGIQTYEKAYYLNVDMKELIYNHSDNY